MRRILSLKIISLVLMVLTLAGMLPAFATVYYEVPTYEYNELVEYETEDGFVYTVTDGTATIKDYTGSDYEIEIPAKIDDYAVVAIGHSAFADTSVKSVTIPASVNSISDSAFKNYDYLEKIVVDRGNLVYDSREDCNAIIETATHTLIKGCKSTVIPNSVKTIGSNAFYTASMENIVIPAGVTAIDSTAFYALEDVKSITVDKNNTVYDSREGCNAIIETKTCTLVYGCKNTVIPSSVCAIGDYAFYDSDITKVDIPKNVTSIGAHAFDYCTKITSLTIPSNVKSIGNDAFRACYYLATLNLSEGIESIGEYAFGWANIKSLYIPASVTNIEYKAFIGCNELAEITVSSYNEVYDSREDCNAIIETDTNTIVEGCLNTVIPASVKHIGSHAFYYRDITSVELPGGVKTIGSYAFGSCYELKSISIPKSVKTIATDAFSGCDKLLDVYYEGTQEEWKKIEGVENVLTEAKIYYEITLSVPTPETSDEEEDSFDDGYSSYSYGSAKRKKKDDGNTLWVIVGCAAGAVLIAVVALVLIKKKKSASNPAVAPIQVAVSESVQNQVVAPQPQPVEPVDSQLNNDEA